MLWRCQYTVYKQELALLCVNALYDIHILLCVFVCGNVTLISFDEVVVHAVHAVSCCTKLDDLLLCV